MKRLALVLAALLAGPALGQTGRAAMDVTRETVNVDGSSFSFAAIPPPSSATLGCIGVFLGSPLNIQCAPASGIVYTTTTKSLDVTDGRVQAGNLRAIPLPASGSITVTPQGTTGSTTYTYSLQACLADGTCNAAGAASTTAAGNATLSATNFNRLSWSAVAGAASYKVRRDVGGATQGVIWSGTGLTVNDTGLAGDGTAKPIASMTGTVQAANYKTDANGNVASGHQSQRSLTTGSSNVASGTYSQYSLTAGHSNVAVGYNSGYYSGATPSAANAITTSTSTTFIGHQAGLGSPTQRTNVTAIGAGAYVDADNRVVLGDGSVADVWAGSTGQARLVGTGLRLNTGVRPTCDASTRGLIWYVAGGAGAADTCEVCRKDAGDAYAWVSLF